MKKQKSSVKPWKKQEISKIDEHLYLGDCHGATNHSLLEALNIRHILQLIPMPEDRNLESRIGYLRLPIRGGKNIDIEPIIPQTLSYIHGAVSNGENILVHCKHGMNRSASIVVAFIMAAKNMTFIDAEKAVIAKRPIIEIRPHIKSYLCKLGSEGLRKIMIS